MAQELKAISGGDIHDIVEYGDGSEIYHDETLYYLKNVADEALAEKDAENRRLKRALWLARAKRAIEKIAWFKLWNASISTMNPEDGARQEYDKWKNALGRFLAKAEEYR